MKRLVLLLFIIIIIIIIIVVVVVVVVVITAGPRPSSTRILNVIMEPLLNIKCSLPLPKRC